MVPILDGNSERMYENMGVFLEKKNRFVTALDLIKCLNQMNSQILLLTCAPISELPSDIRTY